MISIQKNTVSNPSKHILGKHPLFLKNKVLNQVTPLYEDPALLSLPTRKIQRIYVEPEQFSRAKVLLNN